MVILRVCVCVVLCVSSPAKSVRALRVYNFYIIRLQKRIAPDPRPRPRL